MILKVGKEDGQDVGGHGREEETRAHAHSLAIFGTGNRAYLFKVPDKANESAAIRIENIQWSLALETKVNS